MYGDSGNMSRSIAPLTEQHIWGGSELTGEGVFGRYPRASRLDSLLFCREFTNTPFVRTSPEIKLCEKTLDGTAKKKSNNSSRSVNSLEHRTQFSIVEKKGRFGTQVANLFFHKVIRCCIGKIRMRSQMTLGFGTSGDPS